MNTLKAILITLAIITCISDLIITIITCAIYTKIEDKTFNKLYNTMVIFGGIGTLSLIALIITSLIK